jgi:hypothetical protein
MVDSKTLPWCAGPIWIMATILWNKQTKMPTPLEQTKKGVEQLHGCGRGRLWYRAKLQLFVSRA